MFFLAHKSVFFEDLRLCTPSCSMSSIGLWHWREQGLRLDLFEAVHADPLCQKNGRWPLQYLAPLDSRLEWMTNMYV